MIRSLVSSTRSGSRARPLLAAALAAGLSACSSSPVATFDLSAGGTAGRTVPGGGTGQVVVPEPAALAPLEAERILVRDPAGAVSYLGNGQWADRLPRLVQTRLIQTFENTSRVRVGRPGDGVTGEGQLTTELRAFQLEPGSGQVVVEISAKLIEIGSGRVVRARIFTNRLPVTSNNPGEVAQALDRALNGAMLDIVRWVGGGARA